METITKTCKKCNIPKILDMFHNSKNGKYGVKSYCKECKVKLRKTDYDINKQTYLHNKKTYYINNKETIVNKVIAYRKAKLNTDPHFKMKDNIRCLIRNAFKRKFTIKSKKTTEILGCTFDEFKKHLESKFDEHMTWNNQGTYWQLDHIKPISLAHTEDDIILLNHYTNFQPLYWEDNLAKGDKYDAVKIEDESGILY